MSKSAPNNLDCDVLVVGGGAAGFAAAVGAERAGARVVLLERYGFLGGLAAAAQVGTVCGLYLRDKTGLKPQPMAAGFLQECASRLERAADSPPLALDAGLWVLPMPPTVFAEVAASFLTECNNTKLVLHATVARAVTKASRVVEVQALAWNRRLTVRPVSVVDCTGEATVASLAGAEVEDGSREQPPALIFTLEHIDSSLLECGLLELRRELRQAVEQGVLPAAAERLAIIPGSATNGRLSLKLNLCVAGAAEPWEQLTAWELESRALAAELCRFLNRNTAACRNARLACVAPQLGVRSGGRIQGRARLTDDDVLNCRKSAAGVARGCWPIERWSAHPRPELAFFQERDYFDIPLDCLRAVGLDNLFAAGRCFSASAGAISSARVIGTALATGYAAGTAAAFQSLNRSPEECIDTLQRQMHE